MQGYMNSTIEQILKGSYDLHVHAAPDIEERRLDVLEVAREAYEAEMAGLVLKSNYYPTTSLAYVLGQMYPGLNVYGAITLNHSVGGLNPSAVQTAGKLGTKIVWLSDYESNWDRDEEGSNPNRPLLDDAGEINCNVRTMLKVIKDNDMVLASGDISPSETIQLFETARSFGITNMIASNSSLSASLDEQMEMISLGARLEYTFLSCMPSDTKLSVTDFAKMLGKVGIEHCIISTDLGQWMNPTPVEGMRMAIASMLAEGMSEAEVSLLVKYNPAKILGAG